MSPCVLEVPKFMSQNSCETRIVIDTITHYLAWKRARIILGIEQGKVSSKRICKARRHVRVRLNRSNYSSFMSTIRRFCCVTSSRLHKIYGCDSGIIDYSAYLGAYLIDSKEIPSFSGWPTIYPDEIPRLAIFASYLVFIKICPRLFPNDLTKCLQDFLALFLITQQFDGLAIGINKPQRIVSRICIEVKALRINQHFFLEKYRVNACKSPLYTGVVAVDE